jgi:hypothetical protein
MRVRKSRSPFFETLAEGGCAKAGSFAKTSPTPQGVEEHQHELGPSALIRMPWISAFKVYSPSGFGVTVTSTIFGRAT